MTNDALYKEIRDENDLQMMRLRELAIKLANDPSFNFPNWEGFSKSSIDHKEFLITELADKNPLLNDFNFFGQLLFCSMLCRELSKRKFKTICAGVYHFNGEISYQIFDYSGLGRKSISQSEFQTRIDRINSSNRIIEISTIAGDLSFGVIMLNEYKIRVP